MKILKKIWKMGLLLISLTFCLTACQVNVNWSDKQYSVPWWVIVIPSIGIVAVALILAGKHIASKEYVCSECGEKFYPKFWQAMFSVHLNDAHVFKCPHCGKKGFCHKTKKDD